MYILVQNVHYSGLVSTASLTQSVMPGLTMWDTGSLTRCSNLRPGSTGLAASYSAHSAVNPPMYIVGGLNRSSRSDGVVGGLTALLAARSVERYHPMVTVDDLPCEVAGFIQS